jgi:SAM-dependent methyltransferase
VSLDTDAGAKVRDFYERMPYPPPLERLRETLDPERDAVRRRVLFHRMWPTERRKENQHILIAGCGTSQAARYALRAPDAHVTAIDVSETSLRHTRVLQRRYDLGNLEVRRLAIEDVAALESSFDMIVCTGVLHHLPDPDLGLRALRKVLRPRGAMYLMVYARYGRAGIYMMQEYCRLLGIGTTEPELRALGATLDALPPEHAIAEVLRHAKDFRRPDAMADALLHPLDRAYTVPELYAWLERCGMSFGRWVDQAPYLARCGMIARSPHADRLAALPERQQHAAVELFRGTMVSHSVIAYRDDYPGGRQAITSAGDHWRGFVPIPVPWTVCLRDRLPRGSAAVLINRSHTFTDLVVTVDAFEDQVLGAIDGTRTVSEILRIVGLDETGERRALGFLDRLWCHDQIVFDASGR